MIHSHTHTHIQLETVTSNMQFQAIERVGSFRSKNLILDTQCYKKSRNIFGKLKSFFLMAGKRLLNAQYILKSLNFSNSNYSATFLISDF